MRYSVENTAGEVERLLTKMGGERRDKYAVNGLVRRISAFLADPISPRRLYNLWRGDARPEPHEVDAIRAAAGIVEEAQHEYRTIDQWIARAEATLLQDADFHRIAINALRAVARGEDRALDRGIGKPSGLEGGE